MSSAADQAIPHISVCVCTYKRPQMLRRLLAEVVRQQTAGEFTFSVVVADNDEEKSAEAIIVEIAGATSIPITYCVEPRQNIALARNKVVGSAAGDYLAFIDDDEFPVPTWLLTLLRTCREYGVDGVLGPVLRHFDETPPKWLEKSKFYVRRVNPTGTKVDGEEARTGNVLIKRELVLGDPMPFRPEFRAGEDQDFFMRKIDEGRKFIWCAEAEAFETVPPARWGKKYLLRKALLRGATAGLRTNMIGVLKSVAALPIYALALPFAFVAGQQHFMTLLVKSCDHLGKLLILVGINPVREEYVLDEPLVKPQVTGT
jgi:glycosyltransferase involved in cell wall biosynthesis